MGRGVAFGLLFGNNRYMKGDRKAHGTSEERENQEGSKI
jgi:hypothetical protein